MLIGIRRSWNSSPSLAKEKKIEKTKGHFTLGPTKVKGRGLE